MSKKALMGICEKEGLLRTGSKEEVITRIMSFERDANQSQGVADGKVIEDNDDEDDENIEILVTGSVIATSTPKVKKVFMDPNVAGCSGLGKEHKMNDGDDGITETKMNDGRNGKHDGDIGITETKINDGRNGKHDGDDGITKTKMNDGRNGKHDSDDGVPKTKMYDGHKGKHDEDNGITNLKTNDG